MPATSAPAVHIRTATPDDREAIYRLRHRVYAEELGQHATNEHARLTDPLDDFNEYIVAAVGDQVAGFVSITPPWGARYSIDKYFARADLPLTFDEGLFEVRILTVIPSHRHTALAMLLMRGAFEWVREHQGKQIVIIGRREVAAMYRKIGLRPLGKTVQSGAVTYELMTATIDEIDEACRPYADAEEKALERIARRTQLKRPPNSAPPTQDLGPRTQDSASAACDHGGAFFAAIGDEFDRLSTKDAVINADVLDAWFPPSPRVLEALTQDPAWILRTSPPTGCEGLLRTIARTRNLPESSLVAGAGSSSLIFLALRHWLNASSRVLIFDPMYGEYQHILQHVIGAQVDRFHLSPDDHFTINPAALQRTIAQGYDMVLLVNPNNPTGRHLPREQLEPLIKSIPRTTRLWIDETYTDYAGPDQSVEHLAAASDNIVICKSLSKVYALSGARAAYLCGPKSLIADLRTITPPWAVSLPAQIAAIAAMNDPAYYAQRWYETHTLRANLAQQLRNLNLEVLESVINSLLCRLPEDVPSAHDVVMSCREQGVYIRNCDTISRTLANRWIRIAVKDPLSNTRVLETLARVIAPHPSTRRTQPCSSTHSSPL